MRLVFMGSAELACASLEAVAALPGHEVVAVVTQPDKPKGRDLQLAPPPVKDTAAKLGLPVQQPVKIREEAALAALRVLRPDLIIVVAYGQFLPKALLDMPAHGCINVHTSLLPRWRGAAPIQYAILHGDKLTGVTTMFINERMDAGDILRQRVEPIRPDDTSGALHDRLAVLGAQLLVETVNDVAAGKAARLPQDEAEVTLARKLTKEDGRVDWRKPAVEIERQVRAFDPWPGAFTMAGELLLKIWQAEIVTGVSGAPGTVLEDLVVVTGQEGLRLREVQPAGKRRMSAAEFLRGHKIVGAVLQ
jgi:methionyl-tRNA formyltransferase